MKHPYSSDVKRWLRSITQNWNPYNHKYHLGSQKNPQVIHQLSKLPKTKTHPTTYLETFHNIILHHPDHQYRFTDGSKDNNKTACVPVLNKTIYTKALSMKNSIFNPEVCAGICRCLPPDTTWHKVKSPKAD